ncbi:HesB/YadR/YfhF family protein [Evansella tamaricis]|uniref:Core domain-containing protein n=1 Tax=Evansella tamaricis TaxID=2069301 RepID=A0ABS6JJ60_9BACI|nr:iron-sulfur cluster biosynthesis family protein [Evansella tamaricis]MBU9713244.1 hypothetical protein [Evansella tamaricis]
MKIDISDKAIKWFQDELDVKPGDGVQFFVRYGGCGNIQTGFSLGVVKKDPEDPVVTVTEKDIHFYIETKDEWYFNGKDFSVDYDSTIDEIQFTHDIQED